MALMPRLNALRPEIDGSSPAFARGGLRQRSDQYRNDYEQSSDDAAIADGGSAALVQNRVNNLKARAMSQNNPEWGDWFQSIRDAGGGHPVKIAMGAPSPDGSNVGDEGPYGDFGKGPATEGPYGPLSLERVEQGGALGALHGRVRPVLEPHDVWRAKTRQRIYGEA